MAGRPGPWRRLALTVPIPLHDAAQARAEACGTSLEKTFLELVESALAGERCRHTAKAAGPPPDDDDEDTA